MISDFHASAIRKVPWSRLPLGCVILEWPTLHAAGVPELSEYPIITERLRDHLTRTYQFLRSRSVTIADPTSGIELPNVRDVAAEAGALVAAISQVSELKQGLRQELGADPGARTGIADQLPYESSPYRLAHRWTRGLVDTLSDTDGFAHDVWPSVSASSTVSSVLMQMLSGTLLPLSTTRLSADIGFDVSRSMTIDGRAEAAYAQATTLLTELVRACPMLQWRLWMVSETAEIAMDSQDARTGLSLETLMKRKRMRSAETLFAPFLTGAARRRPAIGPHLVLLVTDGMCSDRGATLRSAEQLARSDTDYVQIILHKGDDFKRYVEATDGRTSIDNVRTETDLTPNDRLIERTDEQHKAAIDKELRGVTDIAEAAHGAQLILTYFPLFSVLTLDMYEQYVGQIAYGGS